eukprot:2932887-Rhodomonas_salina.1
MAPQTPSICQNIPTPYRSRNPVPCSKLARAAMFIPIQEFLRSLVRLLGLGVAGGREGVAELVALEGSGLVLSHLDAGKGNLDHHLVILAAGRRAGVLTSATGAAAGIEHLDGRGEVLALGRTLGADTDSAGAELAGAALRSDTVGTGEGVGGVSERRGGDGEGGKAGSLHEIAALHHGHGRGGGALGAEGEDRARREGRGRADDSEGSNNLGEHGSEWMRGEWEQGKLK